MCADEECDDHEDERHDVGQYACSHSLPDGADQRDAVADVEGRVVPPDLDELLLAFAAAAELSGAATAASRCLQDAHLALVCPDAFHHTLVLYRFQTAHFVFKIMQRYIFSLKIPNYIIMYFVFLHKNFFRAFVFAI